MKFQYFSVLLNNFSVRFFVVVVWLEFKTVKMENFIVIVYLFKMSHHNVSSVCHVISFYLFVQACFRKILQNKNSNSTRGLDGGNRTICDDLFRCWLRFSFFSYPESGSYIKKGIFSVNHNFQAKIHSTYTANIFKKRIFEPFSHKYPEFVV